MDAERAREYLLSLPHVVETQQWGDNLVYWVGDKAIGGRMFCLVDLSSDKAGGVAHGVISFAAGPERFTELLEHEGLKPAPYLARAHWIAAAEWSVLRHGEWLELLRAAHAIVLAKLTKRARDVLAMPARQRNDLIRIARKRKEEAAAGTEATKRKG